MTFGPGFCAIADQHQAVNQRFFSSPRSGRDLASVNTVDRLLEIFLKYSEGRMRVADLCVTVNIYCSPQCLDSARNGSWGPTKN